MAGEFGRGQQGLIVTAAQFLWGLFGGKIDSAVKRALEGLRDAFSDVADALAEFMRDTAMVFATVWAFLRKFWTRVLLPMLRQLDQAIGRLAQWLRDTFGPVIAFLQDVRRAILRLYDKWLRPIFDTIDVIRRVLGIFSLFGLDWARELDRKLAELQDRLMAPIRLVLQKVNEVIEIVDRIVTLDGVLQRITLFRSLLKHERDVWAGWWHSVSQREAEKGPPASGTLDATTPKAAAATVAAAVEFDRGTQSPRIKEYAATFRLVMARGRLAA